MTQLFGKTRARIGGMAAAATVVLLLATMTPASAAEVSRVEGPFVSVTPTALAGQPCRG